ncbi:hypothetical protein BHE74_00044503 [Ensete ventricosum]|nr:hypothetical protein BHE74_00044503 [Ensete ventricosum]
MPVRPLIGTRGREKEEEGEEEEKKRENLEKEEEGTPDLLPAVNFFVRKQFLRPRAISSPRTGRRNISPCGEKKHLPTSAISNHTARYGRYIPVHPLIGMQTARYQGVPPIEAISAPRFRGISAKGGRKKRREKKRRRKRRTWRKKKRALLSRSVVRERFLCLRAISSPRAGRNISWSGEKE